MNSCLHSRLIAIWVWDLWDTKHANCCIVHSGHSACDPALMIMMAPAHHCSFLAGVIRIQYVCTGVLSKTKL